MTIKENLAFSVYDYLKYCKTKAQEPEPIVRGVGIVTAKQFIFYTQLTKGDNRCHPDIAVDLENDIHPNNYKRGMLALRSNNAYLWGYGLSKFEIWMPETDALVKNQEYFLLEVLEQIEKYNSEQHDDEEKILIQVFWQGGDSCDEYKEDITSLKEKIKSKVKRQVRIESEKIIGETPSKELCQQNIDYHISLADCTNFLKLKNQIAYCSLYYQDINYKEVFFSKFPTYSQVRELITLIDYLQIPDFELTGVTFENIKEKLEHIIETFTQTLHTTIEFWKIKNMIDQNKTAKDIIATLFPPPSDKYNK